jgi:hypothetical protein
LEYNASALDVFGIQRFSFGRFWSKYNASALDVFGIQRFSFGRFWNPTLQLWKQCINSPKLKRWTPEKD